MKSRFKLSGSWMAANSNFSKNHVTRYRCFATESFCRTTGLWKYIRNEKIYEQFMRGYVIYHHATTSWRYHYVRKQQMSKGWSKSTYLKCLIAKEMKRFYSLKINMIQAKRFIPSNWEYVEANLSTNRKLKSIVTKCFSEILYKFFSNFVNL